MKGITDLVLLSQLAVEPSYGYALAADLEAAGLDGLPEATVYGALRRMEASGLITSTLVASTGGPARRYFSPTAAGRTQRRRGVEAWRAFVEAVDPLLDVEASIADEAS
jgi:PadR family transcriptional regulator PadR